MRHSSPWATLMSMMRSPADELVEGVSADMDGAVVGWATELPDLLREERFLLTGLGSEGGCFSTGAVSLSVDAGSADSDCSDGAAFRRFRERPLPPRRLLLRGAS